MGERESARRPSPDSEVAEVSFGASETLGERLHQGDLTAFDEVHRDLCPRIGRRLKRKYGRLLRAQEEQAIAVEALEQGFLRRAKYDPARPLEPWLGTIADHRAADLLGSRQKQGRPLEVAMDPGRLAELHDAKVPDPADFEAFGRPSLAEERRDMVQAALGALPADYRKVAWDWACSPDRKLPVKRLAAEGGVTARAIQKRKARAFAMLETELRRSGVENLLRQVRTQPYIVIEGQETENGERRTMIYIAAAHRTMSP